MLTPFAKTKQQVHDSLHSLAETSPAHLRTALERCYHPNAQWRGAHPFNELSGIDAIEQQFWQPLLRAFPDLERCDSIFVGGVYEGRHYVAAVGHYVGTFEQAWAGIPATRNAVSLRYGEVHELRQGQIVQSNVLIDVLDVMRQAGHRLQAPSLGVEGFWHGPATGDGIRLHDSAPAQSQRSLALVLAMQKSLGDYDDTQGTGREGLLTMPQKEYWHPKMMWYGPCGIGTTRRLEGFVDFHQLPFRTAFPNRRGGNHYIRIGDGDYAVTGGWPSVYGEHHGDGWLGMAPTGKTIQMRVMDFYRCDGNLIRENWVPIDILHILLQMNVDLLGRLQARSALKAEHATH